MNSYHMNDIDIAKYIIRRGQRFFIDICDRGCGSGCAYCYVNSKDEGQELLTLSQVQQICEWIDAECGNAPKIISLCPNTEPMKSPESIELTLYVVRFFSSRNSYIQISTKERMPKSFLREINQLTEGRIFINVSIPYVVSAATVEPHAAPVEERLRNFFDIKEYPNLNACLYIKPFGAEAAENRQLFVDIIQKYGIETVCVGVEFPKGVEDPCLSLYDKKIAPMLFGEQAEKIDGFVREVRQNTGAKVFGSSVCCIYHYLKENCLLDIPQYDYTLCEDCDCR